MHLFSSDYLKFTLKYLRRSNFSKEQCMVSDDDRVIETCKKGAF